MTNPVESLGSFRRFVDERPLAVVATIDPSGGPQAALVSVAATDDGALLFNSPAAARKIRNIADGARVALVIGCVGDETLQVEGDAAVQYGAEREVAVAAFVECFPDARTSSPAFALVRVRPRWLRYYRVQTGPPLVREGAPPWAPER